MEAALGDDYYFVHFNKQLGVADAVFDADPERSIRNLYRKNAPLLRPKPGRELIEIARDDKPTGDPLLTPEELSVYVTAFAHSGFTGGINWYRNLNRNWHLLTEADPVITQPALMIYGLRDAVTRSENLADFVPNVEELSLDSGHLVPQERREEATAAIIAWLTRTPPVRSARDRHPVFSNADAFRDWLEANHRSVTEAWVLFHKKGSGLASQTWSESVDVALCFGWIDGLRKSVDGNSYKIRFTPRKPSSVWSAVNVKKVEALKLAGKMRPEGLALFESRSDATGYSAETKRAQLDAGYEQEFKDRAAAWESFSRFAPSYQRAVVWWVMSAKREDTRRRRLETLIYSSEQKQRVPSLQPKATNPSSFSPASVHSPESNPNRAEVNDADKGNP